LANYLTHPRTQAHTKREIAVGAMAVQAHAYKKNQNGKYHVVKIMELSKSRNTIIFKTYCSKQRLVRTAKKGETQD